MSACTEYLGTAKFNHISQVREVLSLCANVDEIEEVIGVIPTIPITPNP